MEIGLDWKYPRVHVSGDRNWIAVGAPEQLGRSSTHGEVENGSDVATICSPNVPARRCVFAKPPRAFFVISFTQSNDLPNRPPGDAQSEPKSCADLARGEPVKPWRPKFSRLLV
jgi:hypothetical protein